MVDIYKWIWNRIGKRPWTFVTRDLWVQMEYIFIVGFTTIGFFTGYYWKVIVNYLAIHPLILFACGFGLFTIGFILGHIFWGSRWIKGQRGE